MITSYNGTTTDFAKHRQTSNTIAEQTKAFLAGGGKVKKFAQGKTAKDYNLPILSTATKKGGKKGISTKRASKLLQSHHKKSGGY